MKTVFFVSCTGVNGVGGGGVIGGIVGKNRNSTLKNCGYFSTGYNYLFGNGGGGIVGANVCERSVSDAIVVNCYFIGMVMPKVVTDYGGVVCYNETTADANEYKAIVENCYAYVDITESYKSTPGTYFCGLFGLNEVESLNCSGFVQNGTECLLDIPVTIGGQEAGTLLEALNLWIIKQDDPAQYRNWIYNESGLPEFENSDFEISEYDLSAYEVLLYPNPTDGIVRIEGIDEAEVTAYNILGQKVRTEQNTNEIDMSHLSEGVYLLRIKATDGSLHIEKVTVGK